MRWRLSYRADPLGRVLADRHYNRQRVGHPQFVPPGRCVVLVTECSRAVWVTSWPEARYVKHAWAGSWVNSLFRNEGAGLSSELIREAIAATRWVWPEPPERLVSFVDGGRIRSPNPGFCYLSAGFHRDGKTKGGLHALVLERCQMPPASEPISRSGSRKSPSFTAVAAPSLLSSLQS